MAVSSGAKVAQVYIPTPDASKVWKDYSKYYSKDFSEPSTYIRFSATVEETSGTAYCMDEADEEFLKKFNSSQSQKCTEDEFEMIMDKFEELITEKQPFLSMDPTQVLSFKELAPAIIERITDQENDPANPEILLATMPTYRKKNIKPKNKLNSFKQFGESIYPYWKDRKVERKGKPIAPILKFEDSEKDDSDPYVCFRRREVRQVRKTRRMDTLSSEKLRKLYAEMQSAKELMQMVAQRETMRKEALQAEMDIFNSRCKIKDLKRTLNIKGDDEDLVTHKKRKNVAPPKPVEAPKPTAVPSATEPAVEVSAVPTNSHPVPQVPPNVRLPASKIPDIELVSLEHVNGEKEIAIQAAVKEKLRSRAHTDKEFINYTDNPYIPYLDYFDPDDTSRNALSIIQPNHAAFSSIATAYPPPPENHLKIPSAPFSTAKGCTNSYVMEAEMEEDGNLKVTSVASEKDGVWSNGGKSVPRGTAVSLRKRVGRGGRIMVDRRGLIRRPQALNNLNDESNLVSWSGASEDIDGMDSSERSSLRAKLERLDDRNKYDSDVYLDGVDYPGSDPSRLNGISEETQSIRFGSMLMSKAYDSYWEAYKQRQQQLSVMHKMLQEQQHQQQQQQAQQAQVAQQQQQAGGGMSNSKQGTSGDQAGMRKQYSNSYGQGNQQQQQQQQQQQSGSSQNRAQMDANMRRASMMGGTNGSYVADRSGGQGQGQQRYDGMPMNKQQQQTGAATSTGAPNVQYGTTGPINNKGSSMGGAVNRNGGGMRGGPPTPGVMVNGSNHVSNVVAGMVNSQGHVPKQVQLNNQ